MDGNVKSQKRLTNLTISSIHGHFLVSIVNKHFLLELILCNEISAGKQSQIDTLRNGETDFGTKRAFLPPASSLDSISLSYFSALHQKQPFQKQLIETKCLDQVFCVNLGPRVQVLHLS